MGARLKFSCKKCGAKFEGDVGSGFNFRLLRCPNCGKEITEKRKAKISLVKCSCGNKFRENLPPRCPKCKSKEVIDVGTVLLYD